MTEEQKQALIARCNYLIGGAPEIDVQLAEFALAALTQPASPYLKLPDDWVAVPREATREMIESGWTYHLITKDPSAKGIWACMIAAATTVPHTAPIEPICDTGGAEWVKVPRKLTADNGAKSTLIGEFKEEYSVSCPECFGEEECETCDGSGRIHIEVPVSWTTIKAIWDMGVEHFTTAPEVK